MKIYDIINLVEAVGESLLYHSTGTLDGLKILSQGVLKNDRDSNYGFRPTGGVCLTRDIGHATFGDIIFVFDRNKLLRYGIRPVPYSFMGQDEDDREVIDASGTITNDRMFKTYNEIQRDIQDVDRKKLYTRDQLMAKRGILDHIGRRAESEERVYRYVPIKYAERIIIIKPLHGWEKEYLDEYNLNRIVSEYRGKVFFKTVDGVLHGISSGRELKNWLMVSVNMYDK